MCNIDYATFFIILGLSYAQNQFAAGPLLVNLQRFTDCPGKVSELKVEMGVRKVSRSITGINVAIDCPYPIGNNSRLRFDVARWGDGGWKYNLLHLEHNDVCEGLNKFLGGLWHTMQDKFEPKMEKGKCPIPAGIYHLHNHTLNFAEMAFPFPFVGRFLVTTRIFRDRTIEIMCLEVESTIMNMPIKWSKKKKM